MGHTQTRPKRRDTDEPPLFGSITNFYQGLASAKLGNLGSMSSTSAPHSNEYDLVSSFYGPGAVVGWYLTVLACLVSYCLHPRKRIRDSITADLLAVLTFPTVAAADLITQVRSYPREGATLAQYAASIKASLSVTEVFLRIDAILLLLAVKFRCMRRMCLLATVGLFCFSAEWYVILPPSKRSVTVQNFDTVFSINFGTLLYMSVLLLVCCVNSALADYSSPDAKWLSIIMLILGTFVAFATGLLSGFMFGLLSQFRPRIRIVASRIAHELIPKSNTSVKELDQAVAILAGASVLGFTLYSTADTYYKAWLSKTRAINQQRGTELRPLNRN